MALSRIMEDKRKILEWLFLDIENSLVAYLPASTVYNYSKKTLGLNSIRRQELDRSQQYLTKRRQRRQHQS